MFVCLCFGVTESELTKAIQEGHDSVSEINQELGAAGCCGSCVPAIEALINSHKKMVEESHATSLYQAAAG